MLVKNGVKLLYSEYSAWEWKQYLNQDNMVLLCVMEISDVKNENDFKQRIEECITFLSDNTHFTDTKNYMQHGDVSVYEHCIDVAYISCYMAAALHIKVDFDSLIRGALLHDYFLYDWHEKSKTHRLHGFFHPGTAYRNARKELKLNLTERDIILRHMFPLTVIPPASREAWIVCIADKLCAVMETFHVRQNRWDIPNI